MSFVFKAVLMTLVLLLAGVGLVALRMVEDQPLVSGDARLGRADLSEAQAFLQNSDPRSLAAGETSVLTLGQPDIELLLDYLLLQLQGGKSRVELQEGAARVDITARLPDRLSSRYLNLQLLVTGRTDALILEQLQVGSVRLPQWLARALLENAHEILKKQLPEYVAALDAVNSYSIGEREIRVVYQWQPDLIEQISNRGRDMLVSGEDRERLLAHARNLAAVTTDPGLPGVVSASVLLGPMFGFAGQRGGDPVEENRAAILVLATYVMGVSLPRVLGEAENSVPAPVRHQLTLSGRRDLAQHFLVSAGLSVSAGTGIADMVGLLKELDDTGPGGSGFSFVDLGADRTGVRFAELAVASPDTARALQERIANMADEDFFMPQFNDLPEFMSQGEFQEQFGSEQDPAFQAMQFEIEARIEAAPLFAGLRAGESRQ